MSRTNRSRIVVGSIVGAFAIHIAALACSGNGSVVGAPDASMSDAGQVVAHDGGVLDVIASALDALGDAARDVATQVVDSEVRDARAGGDAGTGGECQCVRPTSSTFSFTLDRGRGPETPVARFSTASGSVTLGIGTGGVTGPAVYQTTAFAMGYLADGTRFQVVLCSGHPSVGTPARPLFLEPGQRQSQAHRSRRWRTNDGSSALPPR
jgi:hypothetical protein